MDLAGRHHASHVAALGALTESSPGGRVARLDGLVALVTPERPDRSLFNSVVYEDPDALVAALGELATLYAEAGVRAWTVWVPPADAHAVGPVLQAAGHVLDGAPQLMAAALEDMPLDAEPPEGVAVGPAGAPDCGTLNDAAWELEPGTFAGPLSRLDGGPFRWAGAVEGGRLLSCVGICDHEGDAYVTFVATHHDGRGRGLASATLTWALREAARRGCTTTSLEATTMGRPVYARMGYQELGAMQMWERRTEL